MYIYKHLQQIIKLIHLPFYSYLICTWTEQVFYGTILPYLSAIDFSSSLSDSLLFVQQSFHCQLSGSCKSFLTIIWHCSLLLCSIHFEHVLSSGTLCISLPWSSLIKCCSSLIIIYWHLDITFWFILSPAESRRLTSSNPLPSAILLTKLTKLFRLLYTTLCYCCIGIRVKIYT